MWRRLPGLLSNEPPLPRSYLAGAGLSIGTDTDHDIDIAVGVCRDSTNTNNLEIRSTLVKQIDAAFAAGTAAGGLGTLQIDGAQTVTFNDNGGSPDDVTIDASTWSTTPSVGDTLVVTGSASNDGPYEITAATTTVINVAMGSFVGEGTSAAAIRHVKIDTWYHVFAIGNEVGFDTSVTAANLIAESGANSFRRIGSILTDATANILAFVQIGDRFLWATPAVTAELADAQPSTDGTTGNTPVTLQTPLGVSCTAICQVAIDTQTGGVANPIHLTHLDTTNTDVEEGTANQGNIGFRSSAIGIVMMGMVTVDTDTNSQVRARADFASVSALATVNTEAYIDRRGQDD